MHRIRPTIKALCELPRDSSLDPAMLEVAASGDERKILTELRVSAMAHPLLEDANRQITQNRLSSHQSASTAASQLIYEARQRDGAGWRGAFVRVDGSWWLVYADRHDEFNSRVAEILKASRSAQWMPTNLDWDVLDAENADDALYEWRTAVLRAFVGAVASAAAKSGTPVLVVVPKKPDLPGELKEDDPGIAEISVKVLHNSTLEVDPSRAHHDSSFLELELRIRKSGAAQAAEIHRELINTCVPYLGVPQEELSPIYGRSGSLKVSVLLTHAKLLQLSQDPGSGITSASDRMVPGKLHYASKTTITAGFITGSTVEAICGFKFVPTRDEYTAAGLPICSDCEENSPSDPIIVSWKDGL